LDDFRDRAEDERESRGWEASCAAGLGHSVYAEKGREASGFGAFVIFESLVSFVFL
jgi:hypothetical protein